MCFPAKEVTAHAVRGFESHPLRHTTLLSFNIRTELRTLRFSISASSSARIERLATDQKVGGSNPSRRARFPAVVAVVDLFAGASAFVEQEFRIFGMQDMLQMHY